MGESVAIAGLLYRLYRPGLKEAVEDRDEDTTYEAELSDTHALMIELKAEHAKTDPLVSAIQRPRSGRYEGRSAEDDDGDQAVMTHLNFRKDGSVDGWGEDSADGRYIITDGVWSTTNGNEMTQPGGRVAWIEKYDEGFEVALRGQVRPDGTILAL